MSITGRLKLKRAGFVLDVDFTVPKHGVTALFGPSGSGKTTLLRAIAGLERETTGFLQVNDKVWQDNRVFAPPEKRSVGYVFQEANLFPHLDVRGNIDYGRRRRERPGAELSLGPIIELLDVGHLMSRYTGALSGGERQRVAIARALASSPALLLLDEPLAALDTARKEEILPYLESLHRELELPIIYVSHARGEVARLADHMLLMDAGHIAAAGPVGELFTRLDLALAHTADAETLIEARVTGFDPTYGLSRLECEGGSFLLAGQLDAGATVRLRVAARDVSLTLARQSGTSILNVLPVTVDSLVREDDANLTVRLMAGGLPMLSRITRKSADDLKLAPGNTLYAQIKSVALAT